MSSTDVRAPVALSARRPFPAHYVRDEKSLQTALSDFILSVSGWRRVFGADAESKRAEIDDGGKELAAVAAHVFARFLKARLPDRRPTVALGVDTRPTGPAIASIAARALLAADVDVAWVGPCAGPEIMAWVHRAKLSGFLYLSASHNPIGHNGFKFGLSDGGVLGQIDAQTVISAFQETIGDIARSAAIIASVNGIDDSAIESLESRRSGHKRAAIEAYRRFIDEVVTGLSDPAGSASVLGALADGARGAGIGVVVDFNGSARAASIDRDFLSSLGVTVECINDTPGAVAHTIVPEGDALDPCRRLLESAHKRNPGFLFGYVPDNDGDRGNLVYYDEKASAAKIMPAQEVFALCCMAELAYSAYLSQTLGHEQGSSPQKTAVVVNGPTSMRVDAIARLFEARVFRSEVGEANVVNLARDSRKSGFSVRIMGEGSNGGNITYPSAVRDPLSTLFAVLKLLALPSLEGKPGPLEIWCAKRGIPYLPDATLADIIDSLPPFTTTEANDPRAILALRTLDHAKLKECYEQLFVDAWDRAKDEFADRFGITTWEEVNYEAINEVHGFGRSYRSGKQRGGMKIVFKDDRGRMVAFVWMRGSGTEPVFRVLADIAGRRPADERWLLDWHTQLVRKADELATAQGS